MGCGRAKTWVEACYWALSREKENLALWGCPGWSSWDALVPFCSLGAEIALLIFSLLNIGGLSRGEREGEREKEREGERGRETDYGFSELAPYIPLPPNHQTESWGSVYGCSLVVKNIGKEDLPHPSSLFSLMSWSMLAAGAHGQQGSVLPELAGEGRRASE